MGVLWRIAFRNLREHKTKTLIIGSIITIGIAVLIVGNSLMDTATAGLKQTYIENYTGHIVVTGRHDEALSLFGSSSADKPVPLIPEFETVQEYIGSLDAVEVFTPQAVGQATVSHHDEVRGFALLFGIIPSKYMEMFPDNIEIVAGRFLQDGEEGILLSERLARRLVEENEQPIAPGDSLLLTGMSLTGGTKIRNVVVRGIFRFRNSDMQLDHVSLIDITNLRALMGMNTQGLADLQLSEFERQMLGEIDEEALFGGGDDFLFAGPLIETPDVVTGSLSESDVLSIFFTEAESDGGASAVDDTLITPQAVGDSGTWHFLLIKLKNPNRIEQVRRQIEEHLAAEGIDIQTRGWVEGAGILASMTSGIKTVFNIIVLIVAVVAVIIIMNTLVISITERIAEIGTMRAIGAQRSFIRKMVMLETVMITGIFGGIGVLSGGVILAILRVIGIEAPNMFFKVLFGGDVLQPVLSPGSVVMSLAAVTVISLVASSYPVSIALQIQPVKAMQS
ncbi:MAG TPA: ABC transporter permease [Firmicutes bacterium]|nr:ABC transporter permease [Bacillota bacterium]